MNLPTGDSEAALHGEKIQITKLLPNYCGKQGLFQGVTKTTVGEVVGWGRVWDVGGWGGGGGEVRFIHVMGDGGEGGEVIGGC